MKEMVESNLWVGGLSVHSIKKHTMNAASGVNKYVCGAVGIRLNLIEDS
jgi:hypothetical protein